MERKRLQAKVPDAVNQDLQDLAAAGPTVIYSRAALAGHAFDLVGPNVVKVLGFDAARFLDDPGFWASRIHPDDADRVFDGMEALLLHGHHRLEYRFKHDDGDYRWLYDALRLVRDGEGKPVQIIGSWTDMTGADWDDETADTGATASERMEIRALRESEKRLHLILDMVPAAIAYIDSKQRHRFNNQVYRDWTRRTHEQLQGRHVREVSGDASYQVSKPRLEEALAGRRVRYKNTVGHQNGVGVIRDVSMVPDFDVDGSVKGLVMLSHDITQLERAQQELKRARDELEHRVEERTADLQRLNSELESEVTERKRVAAALHESEAQLRLIIDSVPAAIAYVGRDLRYRFHNQAFSELHGGSNQEITGRHAREVLGDEVFHLAKPHIDKVLLGEAVRFENTISLKSGKSDSREVSLVPDFDGDGSVKGYFVLSIDMTERKRMEDMLRMAKNQADLANRAKSDFLAMMSHELRTPLNAIIGFSQIINNEELGPINNTKYREYAGDILDSGQHLLDLIIDILDLSKIEAGTQEVNESEVDVAAVVDSVMTLIGERAERGKVLVEIEEIDAGDRLWVDERKLKQIIVNLMTNAIKFTPAGGRVTLRTWRSDNSGYVFQIADTGIGIALEDIPKAFTSFGQVDSDLNRKYEGTGLGLPLTKALVELHGGSLDLQSKVGVGTVVTVRFPVERIRSMLVTGTDRR